MKQVDALKAINFPGKTGGERIQAAMDSLGENPKYITVGPVGPDADGVWLLKKALVIPSHTTLVMEGAHLFMADRVSDNILRNRSADSGDVHRDHDIHVQGIGEAWLDGNACNQIRQDKVHKNFGISFHKVDRVSIRGIILGPSEGWGMGLENIHDLLVDNIIFRQDGKTANQDGVHVCGPGSRVCVSNIVGTVADDAIAIDAGACNEDYRGCARGTGGYLENVVVSNVSVKNLGAGAVVRTLAEKGKPLDGCFISQVMINGSNQVLKIGWDRWGARQGHEIGDIFPSCDEQKNIVIDGVKGTTDDVFCRIESNVKNLTIKNVRGRCGRAALSNRCSDGYFFSMENVLLDDWILEGTQTVLDLAGGVDCTNLTVKNSVFTADESKESVAIALSGAGKKLKVRRMSLDNVIFNGFKTGIAMDSDVEVADVIRMTGCDLQNAKNRLGASQEKVLTR